MKDETLGVRAAYTGSAVAALEEWFHDYGAFSNEQLLLSYGFVLDPNPDDMYGFSIRVIGKQAKQVLSQSGALSQGSNALLKLFPGGISAGLFALIRTATLSDEQFSQYADRVMKGQVISAEHELGVLTLLLDHVNRAIKNVTSIVRECKTLRCKMASRYKQGLKQLLQKNVGWFHELQQQYEHFLQPQIRVDL